MAEGEVCCLCDGGCHGYAAIIYAWKCCNLVCRKSQYQAPHVYLASERLSLDNVIFASIAYKNLYLWIPRTVV